MSVVTEIAEGTRATIAFTGSLVLSTGATVRVLVEITHDGRLTRGEEQEIENSRIALHDLTPGAGRKSP